MAHLHIRLCHSSGLLLIGEREMQLEMRGVNYVLSDGLKDYIERRLRFTLGRFPARIDRLTVRLSDVNGPRGGIDKRCRIALVLIPRGVVMVEGWGDGPFALV